MFHFALSHWHNPLLFENNYCLISFPAALVPNLLTMKSTRLQAYTNYTMEIPEEKRDDVVLLCDVEFVYGCSCTDCQTTANASTIPSVITIQFCDLFLINEITFEGFYLVGPRCSAPTHRPSLFVGSTEKSDPKTQCLSQTSGNYQQHNLM